MFFFFNNILGFRDFSKFEDIKQYLFKTVIPYSHENISTAKELIIFETYRQKTWLIATEMRLFCVLDDIEKDIFEVRWQLSKDKLISNDIIIIDIKINHNYKEQTGLVCFGNNYKNWLYSKKLYPTPELLKESIIQLIKYKM